jgi:hypothetical protein
VIGLGAVGFTNALTLLGVRDKIAKDSLGLVRNSFVQSVRCSQP